MHNWNLSASIIVIHAQRHSDYYHKHQYYDNDAMLSFTDVSDVHDAQSDYEQDDKC